MCHLQIFDIVECIDDSPVLKHSTIMPDAGRLYRVESTRPVGDGFSVRLVELTPECHLGGACACGQCGWDSSRFRLVQRPDRLAVFREMLEPSERQTAPVADPVD